VGEDVGEFVVGGGYLGLCVVYWDIFYGYGVIDRNRNILKIVMSIVFCRCVVCLGMMVRMLMMMVSISSTSCIELSLSLRWLGS